MIPLHLNIEQWRACLFWWEHDVLVKIVCLSWLLWLQPRSSSSDWSFSIFPFVFHQCEAERLQDLRHYFRVKLELHQSPVSDSFPQTSLCFSQVQQQEKWWRQYRKWPKAEDVDDDATPGAEPGAEGGGSAPPRRLQNPWALCLRHHQETVAHGGPSPGNVHSTTLDDTFS